MHRVNRYIDSLTARRTGDEAVRVAVATTLPAAVGAMADMCAAAAAEEEAEEEKEEETTHHAPRSCAVVVALRGVVSVVAISATALIHDASLDVRCATAISAAVLVRALDTLCALLTTTTSPPSNHATACADNVDGGEHYSSSVATSATSAISASASSSFKALVVSILHLSHGVGAVPHLKWRCTVGVFDALRHVPGRLAGTDDTEGAVLVASAASTCVEHIVRGVVPVRISAIEALCAILRNTPKSKSREGIVAKIHRELLVAQNPASRVSFLALTTCAAVSYFSARFVRCEFAHAAVRLLRDGTPRVRAEACRTVAHINRVWRVPEDAATAEYVHRTLHDLHRNDACASVRSAAAEAIRDAHIGAVATAETQTRHTATMQHFHAAANVDRQREHAEDDFFGREDVELLKQRRRMAPPHVLATPPPAPPPPAACVSDDADDASFEPPTPHTHTHASLSLSLAHPPLTKSRSDNGKTLGRCSAPNLRALFSSVSLDRGVRVSEGGAGVGGDGACGEHGGLKLRAHMNRRGDGGGGENLARHGPVASVRRRSTVDPHGGASSSCIAGTGHTYK